MKRIAGGNKKNHQGTLAGKLLLELVLSLGLVITTGYSSEPIDSYVLACPTSQETSLESVVAYIKKRASSEREMARAIYVWITTRIHYDQESMDRDGGMSGNRWGRTVFKERKGVCFGYSMLFSDMAGLAGLKSHVVNGSVRRRRFQFLENEQYRLEAPHSWVAVVFDGKTNLLDPTWGRPLEKDDFWFAVPPEIFAIDHFPYADDMPYTLLIGKFAGQNWQNTPYATPQFFKLGLRLFPDVKNFMTENGVFNADFQGPETTAISLRWYRIERQAFIPMSNTNFSLLWRAGNWHLKITPPTSGSYLVDLISTDPKIGQEPLATWSFTSHRPVVDPVDPQTGEPAWKKYWKNFSTNRPATNVPPPSGTFKSEVKEDDSWKKYWKDYPTNFSNKSK